MLFVIGLCFWLISYNNSTFQQNNLEHFTQINSWSSKFYGISSPSCSAHFPQEEENRLNKTCKNNVTIIM